MTLQLTTETTQYSLRVPAHRFWQGERCVYYFPLDMATLDGLLPQRVDEDMIKDANRRLTPSHAKDIKDYLTDRSNWLLGAFLLGIAQDGVEFDPYKYPNGTSNPTFGELRLRTNRINTMRIFDGQHRRRAIGDILSEVPEDESHEEQLVRFRNTAVPIVVYEEQGLKELRQMFADASKTKTIEANTVAMFDRRNAFNLAAQWIAENSQLFNGRVDMQNTTVTGRSQHLVSINQLVGILKTLYVGYDRRVTGMRNDEYMLNLDQLYHECKIWADEFMLASREEYQDLIRGVLINPDIPEWRSVSLAFNVTLMRILAGCYHLWGGNSGSWQQLAEFVRSSNLSVGRGADALLVNAGVIPIGGTYPVGRRQEVQGAINYIVAEARKATV